MIFDLIVPVQTAKCKISRMPGDNCKDKNTHVTTPTDDRPKNNTRMELPDCEHAALLLDQQENASLNGGSHHGVALVGFRLNF